MTSRREVVKKKLDTLAGKLGKKLEDWQVELLKEFPDCTATIDHHFNKIFEDACNLLDELLWVHTGETDSDTIHLKDLSPEDIDEILNGIGDIAEKAGDTVEPGKRIDSDDYHPYYGYDYDPFNWSRIDILGKKRKVGRRVKLEEVKEK